MDVFGDRCRAARGNLPSIKRAGSTTLHRNRLKTSFHSATYGPKALRSIYRDLSVLVHYQYSRDSVRYTVPILALGSHSCPSGFTGSTLTNAGECDIVGPREERARVLGRASDREASSPNLLDIAP